MIEKKNDKNLRSKLLFMPIHEFTDCSMSSNDAVDLLLTVTVLATILSGIFVFLITWVCFKCCCQPLWWRRIRSLRRLKEETCFPPRHREAVEMNEIGSGGRRIRSEFALHNQGYVPDRSGE